MAIRPARLEADSERSADCRAGRYFGEILKLTYYRWITERYLHRMENAASLLKRLIKLK
jgi:hypothetical protein